MIINKNNILNSIEIYREYLEVLSSHNNNLSLFYNFFNLIKNEINNVINIKNITYNINFSNIEEDILSVSYILLKDLEVFYQSDPAAYDKYEIIHIYPGFFAIICYRLANILIKYKIPYLPRFLTELAHSLTGIDIHPNASIGEGFFIDHGTGIVIGETSTIGNNVKIYQGVTLGASSLKKGRLLKNQKRHPTILNNVTIYANATIVGGSTVIEDNCVIGANVFISESVKKGEIITIKNNK